MWAWKYREPVLDLFEMITGNRNSYAMFKVGGVRRDIENSIKSPSERYFQNLKKKRPAGWCSNG
jgi:membrane-bound hydrogenase subunit alpha